ncbi:hypothetical protein KCV01_g16641, partial [Aureobasidium melanogenum]
SDIDRIVAKVPGGISNVQDIYGLSPLQDGILFHHLLAEKGDPYLLVARLAFSDRGRLDRFLDAVQQVVDRHDILRTAFVWDQIGEPAQVVWRHAALPVTTWTFDPADGAVAEQLHDRVDPRRHRIDLDQAPLLRYDIALDPVDGRWHAVQRLHHLIGDHSGLEILFDEVKTILAGRGAALLPAKPFRHLVAQARFGIGVAVHEAYFRGQLADVETPSLSFGLGEVHNDGQQVGEHHEPLPASLNARLRVQARQHGVSLASLCHLAWGQVVARSSDQDTSVFGTVLFGRMHGGDGADQAMGLFINTLPLRLDLGAASVAESVRTTHRKLAELLQHEHASLALAQRCSGVQAPTPLFNALLNYRHNRSIGIGTSIEDDLGIDALSGEERTNYPLTLSVEDDGETLGLTAQVVEPLRPEAICGYMRQALESLADALEMSPGMAVRDLVILPAAERHRLLEVLNATSRAWPQDQCVHRRFEAQVGHTPQAIALASDEAQVSYAELNARANRLAHRLIAQGVGPDVHVAVCAERSVELVVGLLAVLKAGGAYVPLDPGYPGERLGYVLHDAAPALLLTDAVGRAALGEIVVDMRSVALDDEAAWGAQPSDNPSVANLTSRHLAYMIYTSGSTGAPKGVMVEHRSVANLIQWHVDTFELAPGQRTTATAGMAFDASAWEIWPALASGVTLQLPPRAANRDHTMLLPWWREQAMHSAFLVTPLAHLAMDDVLPSGLRYLLVGGDRLTATPPFLPTHINVVNNYGPTEITVVATSGTVGAGETHPSIGRPIANTRLYLLDAYGEPVPFGAVGELYIGGAGVARGYWNRPELTTERFLADPFSDVPGARMYRTGDMVRYLPNGEVAYLGRNDDQVKIRGFRIEPGEIEARLLELDDVRDVAVVARAIGAGEKRLVAYVVPQEAGDHEDIVPTLRSRLGQSLPDYMVPSAFMLMDALPLTPNGKLDRRALPTPDDAAYAHERYEAPHDGVESVLAELWQDLLGLERIGRHDNFFALGGHSLLAVRLLGRLPGHFQVELPLSTLFASPTVAQLAEAIGRYRDGTAGIPSHI